MLFCVLRRRSLLPLLGSLPSNVLILRIFFRWHHSYLCSCWHVVYIRTYCVDILRYSTIEPFDEYFFWIYLLTKMTASLKIKLLISKLFSSVAFNSSVMANGGGTKPKAPAHICTSFSWANRHQQWPAWQLLRVSRVFLMRIQRNCTFFDTTSAESWS